MMQPAPQQDPNASEPLADDINDDDISVMVVDDEEVIAEETVELLLSEGFQAQFRTRPREALEVLAADTSITVLLTDLRMPEMNGDVGASMAMRQRDPEHALGVIVMSGHGTIEAVIDAMRNGVGEFLTKPIRPDEVVDAIRRIHRQVMIRRAEARQANRATRDADDLRSRVTAISQQMETLRQALGTNGPDGAKGDFVNMLGHELLTPLVPIVGFADLIGSQPDSLSAAELQRYASEIRDAGQRLSTVVARIVLLAGLERGDVVRTDSATRIGVMCDDVLSTQRAAAAERKVTLLRDGGATGTILTDAPHLRMLLTELVDNAVKVSQPGQTVRLTVTDSGDDLIWTVQDEGPGMSPEAQSVAMRPFAQVKGGTSRPLQGVGVGLPLARELARLLGGTLVIESRPGQGTSARLTLPRAASEASS